MASEIESTEPAVQDMDLFARLSQYFEHIDQNLRNGLGWLIFNASGGRGRRISAFIVAGFRQSDVPMAIQHVPWRDFALNAYMVQVELQSIDGAGDALNDHAKDELEIATRVSRDSLVKMVAADVLVLTGVAPQHRHELDLLDQTVERRHNLHAPTVLVTPSAPHQLAIDMTRIAPDEPYWDRLYRSMYRRSLMAM